jgi:hypothetical protein
VRAGAAIAAIGSTLLASRPAGGARSKHPQKARCGRHGQSRAPNPRHGPKITLRSRRLNDPSWAPPVIQSRAEKTRIRAESPLYATDGLGFCPSKT